MYYTKRVLRSSFDKEKYKVLLNENELDYSECDFEFGIFDDDLLIGAIALDNNCIKQICVDKKYQGEGIAATLVSEIISFANNKGIIDLFVFTKPDYEQLFVSLGFNSICKIDKVVLLENKRDGINQYVDELKQSFVNKHKVGALVMNLNPITKGHLYLIEKALEQADHVHLFLVKEDKSSFPYEVRLKLLEESVRHLSNLTIHSGSDYIISSLTFPTYFIKSSADIDKSYPLLDASIFADYIAKALNITVRFVGSEPYSKTTNVYNQVLKAELPKFGIEVIEIDRVKISGEVVSASKVRNCIKSDDISSIVNFVPEVVVQFLKTKAGKDIIKKIKNSESRH